MKLFIPTIGTKLELTKPWTFELYGEYRNHTLWDFLQLGRSNVFNEYLEGTYNLRTEEVTLPKGTILTVDRIYIRKGKDMKEYDSVTFRMQSRDGIKSQSMKSWFDKKVRKQSLRFWAKLDDINNINYRIIE